MEQTGITPIQAAERINEIDIIRGVALFGILMVNMSFYKYPVYMERIPSQFPEGLERLSAMFIQLFFTGNFYAVFSFLFGLGFFIFMDRTMKKGLELKPLYRRRLAALLVFGLLHIVLFWSGDILFTYAITGFILLTFRNVSLEAIKKWILALFIFAFLFNTTVSFFKSVGDFFAPDKYQAVMDELIGSALVMYTEGTFVELMLYRLVNEIPYVVVGVIFWIPQVLAFFLCGLYAGRKGVFNNIPAHIPMFKKIRTRGLLVGGLFLLLYALIDFGILAVHPLLNFSLLSGINYLASIFIFSAYISMIVLGVQGGFWKKVLTPVGEAGKMALTNYLSQTLICVIIFYGYGFGLYGRVPVSTGILITIAIFLVQVAWSNAWMRKFKYGPMEWFWRFLTYKKRQQFMIK